MGVEGQTFGDYEILAKLGEGGMGAVYKANQPLLNRPVALKVMAPHLASDPAFAARFIREAAAAANLSHPNMVQVYTAGRVENTHYIAMEFVDGESLRKRLDREGKLDPREAVAITVYVAQALQYAWNKARLIHRDIKPDNIFLSTAGEVKVGDLGLAKTVGASTDLTASGTAMGSPHYISPEQARAVKDIDFRADIYSLGCTLYHMLTGKTPYEADDPMVLMGKHVNEQPPAIFTVWPTCPVALAVVVGKMMAKQRHERPGSYEELIAQLRTVHEKLKPVAAAAPIAPPTLASTPQAADASRRTPQPARTPTPASAAKPVARPEGVRGWSSRLGLVSWGRLKPERRRTMLYAAAGVAVVALLGGAVWWLAARAPPDGYRSLFNGKDLTGWKVRDTGKYNAWTAQEGVLVNTQAGTDLISEEQFTDFLFHCEFKIPPGGNSGVYLRGRYEIQIYDDFGRPPDGQTSGGICNLIVPVENASKPAGEWQTLDVGIEGKRVQVVLNGKKVIDCGELTSPTGDALDQDADQPGPIMLQGRFGRVEFRNMRVKPLQAAAGRVDDAFLREVAALPAEEQVRRVAAELKRLNPKFDQNSVTHRIEDGQVIELKFTAAYVADLSPLRALRKLKTLDCGSWPNTTSYSDLSPLRELDLTALYCSFSSIRDLSPLRGHKLKRLAIACTGVTDLSPLAGMPLENFSAFGTRIKDLTPLKDAPLRQLFVQQTEVRDLSPVRGEGLDWLQCQQTPVQDMTPLKRMPLQKLQCDAAVAREPRNRACLNSIATLHVINEVSAREFWKQIDAGRLPEPETVGPDFFKEVAALPAEEQVKRVVAKLKERNMDYDGNETHKIENGQVVEFVVRSGALSDIGPVRALVDLQHLTCSGLSLPGGRCSRSEVRDLGPLKGLRLVSLDCAFSEVATLGTLKEMPLRRLCIQGTRVQNLAPLQGTPLVYLRCEDAPIASFSPLLHCPIREISCSATADLSPLRAIKTLERINGLPATEFWKKVEAGEAPQASEA